MIELRSFKAYTETLEIASLPAACVIGRQTRSGGSLGNKAPKLWDEVFKSGDAEMLLALPHLNGPDLMGWTCDYDAQSATFIYVVCALTPAGTRAPAGFDTRDIPPGACAVGIYGESVKRTLERARKAGYENDWENRGWNAELYLREEEERPLRKAREHWHWLVPVRAKEDAEI